MVYCKALPFRRHRDTTRGLIGQGLLVHTLFYPIVTTVRNWGQKILHKERVSEESGRNCLLTVGTLDRKAGALSQVPILIPGTNHEAECI